MKVRLLIVALALATATSTALAQVKEGWDDQGGRGGPTEDIALPPLPLPLPQGEGQKKDPVLEQLQRGVEEKKREAPPMGVNLPDLEKDTGKAWGVEKRQGEAQQQPSVIHQIIETIIRAQVFFPARTFQAAVENTTKALAGNEVKGAQQAVADVAGFFIDSGMDKMGILVGKGNEMAKRMVDAAVPILAIGLAIAVLTALAGVSVGVDSGPASLGQVFVRWLFVAVAALNAIGIVGLAHAAFGQIAGYVASKALAINGAKVAALILPPTYLAIVSPGFLIIILIFALVVVFAIGLAYLARWVMLMLLTTISPLCIASASLPFGGGIFQSWLMAYVKVELLHLANVIILGVGVSILPGDGDPLGALIGIVGVVGLIGILFTLNTSAYKDVFGGVIAMGGQALKVAAIALPFLGKAGAILALGTSATANSMSNMAGGNMFGLGSGSSTSATGSTSTAGSTGTTSATVGKGVSALSALAQAVRDPNTWQQAAQAARNPIAAFATFSAGGYAGKDDETITHLAEGIGVNNPQGVARIAQAVRSGVRIGKSSFSGSQVAQGLRRNAGLLRAIAREYGGPEQAAAALGFPSFADLAINASAMPEIQPGKTDPADVLGPQMAEWLANPPQQTSPLWAYTSQHDFAAGAFLSRVTGASAEREPLWARTIASARRAYGDSYVKKLMADAVAGKWDERKLMREIDSAERNRALDGVLSSAQIYRFWIPTRVEEGERKRRRSEKTPTRP